MKTRRNSIAVLLAVGVAVVLLLTVLSSGFMLHMVIITGLAALLTSSLNIVYGYAGQISLGHAAFYGIGAYSAALMAIEWGVSPWLTMVAAAVLTFVAGGVVAYPAFRTAGIYFAIVTLAVGVIAHIIMMNWISVTRGAQGLPGVPVLTSIPLPWGGELDFIERRTYAVLVWSVLALWLLLTVALLRSHIGDSWIAIRENERLARSLGIAAHQRKVLAQAIAAGGAGLTGALFAFYLGIVSPASFLPMSSLMVLVTVVVGGSGRLYGPLVGAILLTAVPEMLRFAEEFRLVLFGILLLAVVLLMPKGLVGLYDVAIDRYQSIRTRQGGREQHRRGEQHAAQHAVGGNETAELQHDVERGGASDERAVPDPARRG